MTNNTERLDIRMPISLLEEIEEYQTRENITTRTAAMLELIRIGLRLGSDDRIVVGGQTQRVDIRVPLQLIARIEEYQRKQQIKTRAAAMKELTKIGLSIVDGTSL